MADLAARPRKHRQALRFATSAFVIARETDGAASAEFDHLYSLVSKEDRSGPGKGADKDVVMLQMNPDVPKIGLNGGTVTGLVGSYDTVAERIAGFVGSGVETFLLQFQPFEREMRRFAEEIMPRVRAIAGDS
jgi:alkanesulfonate monooxygenase